SRPGRRARAARRSPPSRPGGDSAASRARSRARAGHRRATSSGRGATRAARSPRARRAPLRRRRARAPRTRSPRALGSIRARVLTQLRGPAKRGAVPREPVPISASRLKEPAWENPLAAAARRRRNVWPSREAMFASLRGRMPFETWEEEFVHLYVDHGVADRPDGQVELLCPGEIEAQVYANAPLTDGFGFLEHLAVPALVIRGEQSP